MKLSQRGSDALVGALVLAAGLVLATAFVITRGWNERRITVYMLSPSVLDLKQNTRVLLQGLQIGEVAGIAPKVDSVIGPPQFVVTLRLRERYSNGTPIVLPRATRAELIQSAILAGGVEVSLIIPPNARFGTLEPGDTIRARVEQTAVQSLKEVADSLKTQVSDILRDTRKLLATLDRTANTMGTEMQRTAPEVRQTLADARGVLNQLRPVLATADSFMGETRGRVGTLHDSLTATLVEARQLMDNLDTLAHAATLVAVENRERIRQTAENIRVVSIKMEYLMDQLSRRPLKVIGGVKPLDHDSIVAHSDSIEAAAAKKQ